MRDLARDYLLAGLGQKEKSMSSALLSAAKETKVKSRDLRDWIAAVDEMGELKRIDGADWDVEIGAITELAHHRGEQGHALLFDNIKGYPRGHRVLANTLSTVKRLATTLCMETHYSRPEFIKAIKRRITHVRRQYL